MKLVPFFWDLWANPERFRNFRRNWMIWKHSVICLQILEAPHGHYIFPHLKIFKPRTVVSFFDIWTEPRKGLNKLRTINMSWSRRPTSSLYVPRRPADPLAILYVLGGRGQLFSTFQKFQAPIQSENVWWWGWFLFFFRFLMASQTLAAWGWISNCAREKVCRRSRAWGKQRTWF